MQRQRQGNNAADVMDTALYDAYGQLIADTDVATGNSEAYQDPVGFGGQHGYYYDTESGLSLLTNRYYAPKTGRFITRDPIGYSGGINLYGFAGNDPVNNVDEDGFSPRRGTHRANVRITENGQLGSKVRFVSGNMSPAEKALGFPQSTLATHTEARAMRVMQLKPGSGIRIVGHYPPCNSCKGKMNAALRAGNGKPGDIIYKWRAGGKTNTWTADGGKAYKLGILDKLGELGERMGGVSNIVEVFNFNHLLLEQWGYWQFGNGSWSEDQFMSWLKVWHPEEYQYRKDHWLQYHT